MWWELKHKQQEAPNARTNINVYSSTRFSGLIFEDEMICILRTARYVMRIKAWTAEDAKRTSGHQRIQQYAIFRFYFWRWNDTSKYVYHELPGMWYEIKQKQQKMPKARANINVYSTRCSGSSLILSCLTVHLVVEWSVHAWKERPRVKKSRCRYISSNGKSKRKCWYTYQVRYVYIPFSCSTRSRCEL